MGALADKLMAGKMPIVVMVIVVIAMLAVLVWAFVGGGNGERGPEQAKVTVPVTCEACGHQWEQAAAEEIVCPKCGAPGIVKNSYTCPKCREEFVGLEVQKFGPRKFKYRRPGEQWQKRMPKKLKCPNCGYESKDIHNYRVGDDGGDDEGGGARRRG